jgi:hypothetical protein
MNESDNPLILMILVPAINILGDHVTLEKIGASTQTPEPLSMDIKGKKKIISAAYGMTFLTIN